MLGSLKDRIVVLGEGIKSQFGAETDEGQKEAVLGAGAEVLAHFQVRIFYIGQYLMMKCEGQTKTKNIMVIGSVLFCYNLG